MSATKVKPSDSDVLGEPSIPSAKLSDMSWGVVIKEAVAQLIVKGGPWAALLGMVLFGGGWMVDKHLTSYFTQQGVVTQSYATYVDQSRKSDETITRGIAALTSAIEFNTKRLDAQEKAVALVAEQVDMNAQVTRQMMESGSKPARDTAEMMKRATELMAPVPKQREEANKMTAEILTTQKAILETLQKKGA